MPGLAARTFVVSSFGKTFHVTGWKVGYCVAPRALTAEFRKIHQFVTFTTFTAAQYALADMLSERVAELDDLGAFYQARRDLFCSGLAESRFRVIPSKGTYFVLADYAAVSDDVDTVFCEWLTREVGVAAIPLSPFYAVPPAQRLVRFCFAKQPETLREAAARLVRV